MPTAVKTHSPVFEDRFVTVNGVRLRYVEAGHGPALVFLH